MCLPFGHVYVPLRYLPRTFVLVPYRHKLSISFCISLMSGFFLLLLQRCLMRQDNTIYTFLINISFLKYRTSIFIENLSYT